MADDIASVGIKVETSDIERANVSLDTLAGKGASVDRALASIEGAAKATGAALGAMGNATKGAADNIGNVAQTTDRSARSIKGMADSLNTAGKAAADYAANQARVFHLMSGGLTDVTKAEARYIQSLTDELQALRLTSVEREKYIAQSRGMSAEVTQIAVAMRQKIDALKQEQAATRESAKSSEGLAGSLGAVKLAAGAIVGSQLVGWAKDASGALFEASNSAERLRTMLNFATGGNSAREIDYLRNITQKLGLEMQSTAVAYGQFQAAAKGTALEGQKSREVFESVAKASAVMGLSAGQTSGVLLALQQMVSKGTVQAEELRGQLGERLPGAFQVAARAMGVTTAELGKMLEQGQIVADDFLPKFARALNDYVGDAAEQAANRLEASTNRLGTAWERLKQAGGDSGISAGMANYFNSLAGDLDAMSVSMEAARQRGEGMWGQFGALIGTMADFSPGVANVTSNLYENEKALAAAKARVAELQKQAGGGVVLNVEMRQLVELINRLTIARSEMQKLRQEASGVAVVGDRPRDIREDNPGLTRGASYARWAKEEAEGQKAVNDLRMKAAGVNKSYYETVKQIQDLRSKGFLGEKEAVEMLEREAQNAWKSSTAGKAAAEAKRAGAKASREAERDAKAAARELEREAKAFDTFMNNLREKIAAQELELQQGRKITESERLRLDFQKLLANGRTRITDARKADFEAGLRELEQLEKEHLIVKRNVDAYKEWAETQEEIAKAEVEASKAREAASRSIDEYITGVLEAQEGLKSEAGLIGMASDKRAVALAQMRVELDLRKKIAAINANPQGNQQWRDQEIQRVSQWAEIEKMNAAQRAVFDEAQKATDSINQSLTDALLRGFESGKDFAKNFRDTLLNMFKTLVLRPIIQWVIAPITGGLGAMLGGNAMAGQGGGMGGGLLNMGSSLFSNMTGNFLGGGSMGAMFANLGAGFTTGLSTLFSKGIGAAISQGFGLIGAGSVGGGIGALLGTAAPILGPLALLAMSGAFSRKHEQHNLMGTFGGATGFEGTWHDYYKGGLLRSSKTVDTPIKGDDLRALRAAWRLQEDAVRGFAAVLGLEADKIDSFTYKINLKLKDLGDPEAEGYMAKVMQRVQEAINAGSNEMAELLIGSWTETTETVKKSVFEFIGGDEGWSTVTKDEAVTTRTYTASEYAREGEKAIDTLTRLATSLKTVNSVFDTLETALFDASLAGGDLASKLIDQFGGTDKFAALTTSYYDGYYSAAEKQATLQRQLTEQLDKLGLTLPLTKDGFRELVEAQDLTTDAGRKAYAALVSLSPAFAQLTDAAHAAFGASGQLADLIRDGLLGKMSGADLGAQMADVVIGGIYNAIAGNFAQQITDLMVQGVVNPMIQAALTGATVSEAVSQAAIDQIVTKATAAAQVLGAILSDEGFKTAMARIGEAVTGLGSSIAAPAPYYTPYQPAARELQQAATAQERAADDLSNAAKSLLDAARARTDDVWGKLSKLYDDQIANWRTLSDEAKAIAGVSGDAARALRGQVESIRAMDAASARLFIDRALSGVMAGAGLPDRDALSQAIDAVRGDLDPARYTSQAELDYDRAVMAAKLGALSDAAGTQQSAADQQVKLLEEQKTYWQSQIDILRETGVVVSSIDRGVALLREALEAERAAMAGQAAGGAAGAAAGTASAAAGDRGGWTSGLDSFDGRVRILRSASWFGDGDWSKLHGYTVGEVAAATGYKAADIERAILAHGMHLTGDADKMIRAYAVGSDYITRDQLAYVHEGERIIPAATNDRLIEIMTRSAAGGGNDALIAEVRALRAEVAALRADQREPAAATVRMARQFDNVTEGGNAMRSEVMEPLPA